MSEEKDQEVIDSLLREFPDVQTIGGEPVEINKGLLKHVLVQIAIEHRMNVVISDWVPVGKSKTVEKMALNILKKACLLLKPNKKALKTFTS